MRDDILQRKAIGAGRHVSEQITGTYIRPDRDDRAASAMRLEYTSRRLWSRRAIEKLSPRDRALLAAADALIEDVLE